jgi:uncharacterized protein (DUF2147 family)
MSCFKTLLRQAMAMAVVTAGMSSALASAVPVGIWIDHTGRGAVEISECDGKLCGRVVWLQDQKNTKACGMQVIGDAKPIGGRRWDKGWIYDPDSDDRYTVELTPMGERLKVVGYMGSKMFSETMIWKRAPADLKRCV